MRQFSVIKTDLWQRQAFYELDVESKCFALYLLTSPHSTMLGAYWLPLGYVRTDMRWEQAAIEKEIATLSKVGFLFYDKCNSWVLIPSFLQTIPIRNPNQAKAIIKLFDQVPKEVSFLPQLIDALIKFGNHVPEESINYLKQLATTLTIPNEVIKDTPSENLPALNQYRTEAIALLNFLNEKSGHHHQASGQNLQLIIERLQSGISPDQCRQVIAMKTRAWRNDILMAKYLRPTTLFEASNFEKYQSDLK